MGRFPKTITKYLPAPMQCCHLVVFMYNPNSGGEIIGQDCRIMCTEGLYLLIAVKATAFCFIICLQVRLVTVVLRAPLPLVRQVQTDLLTLDCLLTGVQCTECWLRRVRVFSEFITVIFNLVAFNVLLGTEY